MAISPGQFRLTRGGSLTQSLTVSVTVGGTATPGTDYEALPTTVFFPAGVADVFLDVIPKPNTAGEGVETVTMTVGAGVGYIPCAPSVASVSIIEIVTPVVTVVASDAFATEITDPNTPNSGQFSVYRSGSTSTPLTVGVAYTGTATAGFDYTLPPTTITFAPGQTVKTVDVVALLDTLPESPETVVLTVLPGADYVPGAQNSAIVTITDEGGIILNLEFNNTFNDTSPNALTPVINGNAQIGVGLGRYGNDCGVFDGVDDFLVFPHGPLLIAGDFTIQCWADLNDTGDRCIFSSDRPGDDVKIFRIQGGNVIIKINDGLALTVSADMSNQRWTHLALSRKNGETRVFVQGIQRGSTVTNWTSSFYLNVVGKPYFDGTPQSSINPFHGKLSDVRFALSAFYISDFLPPYSFSPVYYTPPAFNNVLLLLKGDGLDGSTSIIDSSPRGALVQREGLVRLTTAESKYGGSAIRFYNTFFSADQGLGPSQAIDKLSMEWTDPVYDIGASDFWIECWAKPRPNPPYSTDGPTWIAFNSTLLQNNMNRLQFNNMWASMGADFYLYGTDNTLYQASNNLSVGMSNGTEKFFRHVLAARIGTRIAVWIDGQLPKNTGYIGTIGGAAVKKSGSLTHVGGPLQWGGTTWSYTAPWPQYLDEVRFVKGTVPWGLKNFTPPQAHPTS